MENIFNVVIFKEYGIAKDPHPLGLQPIKPIKFDFKDSEKFLKAELKYIEDNNKWVEVEATLESYFIHKLKTDVGQIISGKVLHYHIGKSYKSVLVSNDEQTELKNIMIV